MSFTGREDHAISLSDASAWTREYRTKNPSATKGHFYGKDAIQAILNQTGCVGIRIYYAIDTAGAKQLIITGVTSDENDLYNGILAERGICCPPTCGVNNPLNSTT
ncbi:MAG: hypothetical protein Q8L90_05015 [Bacteroidota bacterium]|nr:hypothetical protein [Bacteroidota bacterium]